MQQGNLVQALRLHIARTFSMTKDILSQQFLSRLQPIPNCCYWMSLAMLKFQAIYNRSA